MNNKTNFLDKLLQGVEVEWKTLGEVVLTVTAPVKLNKNTYGNIGKIPVIDQGITFIAGYTDEDFATVEAGEYVIFGDHSEHIKYVDFSFIQGADGLKILKSKVDSTKFIYYALANFYKRENNYKRHWSSAKETLIPIPCPNNPKKSLEIQQKIVAILDTFTELTAKLTAELTARKKQYNYYREQLLSFEEGEVEWKTLGELTSLITKGTTPKNYTVTGISFIKTEAFDGTYINPNRLSFIDEETHNKELKRSILNHNDILVTIAGATIGKCAIVPKEILPANTNQALAIIRLKPDVNLKYVFHLIKSNYLKKYIEQNIKGSAQPNLNLEQLNNFTIPYPSAEEQTRIVSILDKFDTLTTSISEGLPKEIELRKKQYEYYRNQLLMFNGKPLTINH
jgi:type I restriction enzyme S subunit